MSARRRLAGLTLVPLALALALTRGSTPGEPPVRPREPKVSPPEDPPFHATIAPPERELLVPPPSELDPEITLRERTASCELLGADRFAPDGPAVQRLWWCGGMRFLLETEDHRAEPLLDFLADSMLRAPCGIEGSDDEVVEARLAGLTGARVPDLVVTTEPGGIAIAAWSEGGPELIWAQSAFVICGSGDEGAGRFAFQLPWLPWIDLEAPPRPGFVFDDGRMAWLGVPARWDAETRTFDAGEEGEAASRRHRNERAEEALARGAPIEAFNWLDAPPDELRSRVEAACEHVLLAAVAQLDARPVPPEIAEHLEYEPSLLQEARSAVLEAGLACAPSSEPLRRARESDAPPL